MKLIRTALTFGIGYVLGTKAGRERYEQIKARAAKFWDSGALQKSRDKAKDAAAATFAQAKATAAQTAKSAAESVKNKMANTEEKLDADVIIVEPLN